MVIRRAGLTSCLPNALYSAYEDVPGVAAIEKVKLTIVNLKLHRWSSWMGLRARTLKQILPKRDRSHW